MQALPSELLRDARVGRERVTIFASPTDTQCDAAMLTAFVAAWHLPRHEGGEISAGRQHSMRQSTGVGLIGRTVDESGAATFYSTRSLTKLSTCEKMYTAI